MKRIIEFFKQIGHFFKQLPHRVWHFIKNLPLWTLKGLAWLWRQIKWFILNLPRLCYLSLKWIVLSIGKLILYALMVFIYIPIRFVIRVIAYLFLKIPVLTQKIVMWFVGLWN